jgi:probable rRNA maturation factor
MVGPMPAYVQTRGLTKRPVRPEEIARRACRMLDSMRLPEAELSILLCSDAVIHDLNLRFRKIDRPTDVLAFAMREGEGGDLNEGLLGDVIISLDTARKQASEHARTIASEVTFLLAHGLLHLLGHDHRDRDEERRMMAMTDVLMSAAITPRKPASRPRAASDRGSRGRRGGPART